MIPILKVGKMERGSIYQAASVVVGTLWKRFGICVVCSCQGWSSRWEQQGVGAKCWFLWKQQWNARWL